MIFTCITESDRVVLLRLGRLMGAGTVKVHPDVFNSVIEEVYRNHESRNFQGDSVYSDDGYITLSDEDGYTLTVELDYEADELLKLDLLGVMA